MNVYPNDVYPHREKSVEDIISPIFERFNSWILDHNREKIEATFPNDFKYANQKKPLLQINLITL